MSTDRDATAEALWRAMSAVMVRRRRVRRVLIVTAVRRWIAQRLYWLADTIEPPQTVWNPVAFEAIRLAHESVATATLGQYLQEPPASGEPSTLWGRPSVIVEGIDHEYL